MRETVAEAFQIFARFLIALCIASWLILGGGPVARAADGPGRVEVRTERITGAEYDRVYSSAKESLGKDEQWSYAKLIDYCLVDRTTGEAVTLDRPIEVDITPKQPDITPRVIEFTAGELREVPVKQNIDGGWSFSIGDSARLLIVGKSEAAFVPAPDAVELPELQEGFARLEIKKTISGVQDMDAVLESVKFTVAGAGGQEREVTGGEFTGALVGEKEWQGIWYMDVPVESRAGNAYTVTEDTSTADIGGYRRTSYVGRVSEKDAGSASAEVMLVDNDTASVSFSSEYESSRNLKIRKVNTDGRALPGVQLSVGLVGQNQTVFTNKSGEADIGTIEYGELYILTETDSLPGFMPLGESVRFRIYPEGNVSFFDGEGRPAEHSDRYRLVSAGAPGDGGDVVLTVKSLPEYRMPKTGGSLPVLYCAVALLLAGAGGCICCRRRKRPD